MDNKLVRTKIVKELKNYIKKTGLEGAVVGISGGIDSSLTTFLITEAIGPKKVLGIHMPQGRLTSKKESNDAFEIANQLGIEYMIIDIDPIFDSYREQLSLMDSSLKVYSEANLKARIRMSILYYYSNQLNKLVIGTGNRTELLLGYYTKYGDGGVDIEPIGDLYKTQVQELAHHVGIPEHIICKPPSAGLWPGQTDEEELGLPYETIDSILMLLDCGLSKKEILNKSTASPEDIEYLLKRIENNRHKRHPPSTFDIISRG